MMHFSHSIIINAPVKEVWAFMINLHQGENYSKWCPEDHISFQLIKGKDLGTIPAIAMAIENIGGKRFTFRYQLADVKKERFLRYVPTFPLSLFGLVHGSFAFKPLTATTTEFTAEVEYGISWKYLGSIIDRIVNHIIDPEALRRHIKQEGENLKMIVESG